MLFVIHFYNNYTTVQKFRSLAKYINYKVFSPITNILQNNKLKRMYLLRKNIFKN